MTIATNTLTTFTTIGKREDLTDKISMISPTDTPFISAARRDTATAKLHEWQTVSLAAVGANAQLEGDDAYAADAGTLTARVGNRMQISRKSALVSGSNDAYAAAGRMNEMAFQVHI